MRRGERQRSLSCTGSPGGRGGGREPVTTQSGPKTKCIFYHLDGFAHYHKHKLFTVIYIKLQCNIGLVKYSYDYSGETQAVLTWDLGPDSPHRHPPPHDSLTSPCHHVTMSQCHNVTVSTCQHTGNAAALGVVKWNKTGEKIREEAST